MRLVVFGAMVFGLFSCPCTRLCADGPSLQQGFAQINAEIQRGWSQRKLRPAAKCTDREFIRRLSLDLMGRPPTVEEVDTFLQDGRPDRRRQLVTHLLKSEDYVQHFADTFDTLLMGRGDEGDYAERRKHQWRAYLERAFRDDRPWNQVVQEILIARPDDPSTRGAIWFLYERNDQHQGIAEAVAPAVFGFRIECAQCHDHPLAFEIEQKHYWGLVAFFNRSKNVQTKNGPRVSESATGGFSEFADLSGDSSPNLLTFLAAEQVQEQRPAKGEKPKESADDYVAAAIEGDPRVPKFSRREKFATQVAASHPMVARAMVNRVWAMIMGRGLVHPFDEMDSEHPPSHPELLEALSEAFVTSGFQVRPLVHSIVLSDAYQLSSVRPTGAEDPASFAWYLERPLTAEQLARSLQLAIRGSFQNDDPLVGQLRQQFREVLPEESVTRIKDALFLSNNLQLQQFIADSKDSGQLIPRVAALANNQQRIAMLYQHIFHRWPTDSEEETIARFLGARSDRIESAIEHVVWSMVTSAEFRFNH